MRVALLLVMVAVAGCASPPAEFPTPASPPTPIPTATPAPTGALVLAVSDLHHDDRFDPANLSVSVGEEVTFRVVGSTPHTVDFEQTDGVSAPHSGNLDEGTEHVVIFTKPGTYPYYCQYHIPGMRGTLSVV